MSASNGSNLKTVDRPYRPDAIDLFMAVFMGALTLVVFAVVWAGVMFMAVQSINSVFPIAGKGDNDLAFWWPFVQPTSLARQVWWVISALIAAGISAGLMWFYVKTQPQCGYDDD